MTNRRIYIIFIITFFSGIIIAQNNEVDISACQKMWNVLTTMKNGIPKTEVNKMLDTVLDSKPYQTMFQHYNRSWRPNHLPVSVFKRMILSLQFPEEYTRGENTRADQMLIFWKSCYNDLTHFKKNLDDLKKTDITKLINEAVVYAQSWLPQGWKIPDSYFFIHPNGGSNAFVINNSQGYDFFQLSLNTDGTINWSELIRKISHELHHLGMKNTLPGNMSLSDSNAFNFLRLFIGEGTATKFVDNAPGGYVPEINSSKGNAFTGKLDALWKEYTSKEQEIFKRFVSTFEKLYQGKMTQYELESEINNYWLAGLKGPAYFLGSELFGAIYYGFGKEGSFAAMENPEEMLDLYNKALKKKPEILNNCFVIPDTVIQHSLALVNTNKKRIKLNSH